MFSRILAVAAAVSLALTGCAKRGTITGGLKDSIAPVLRSSVPKNFSTDFKGDNIRLTFDEYIKLKNLNKQLIISPPMDKAPEVTPTTASKYINIRFRDTLLPNTTYSVNFGQAIEDNNEGNPYKQFKYVFSTGPYIDSLSLSGRIKDAHDKKTDNFVNVMLYEANEAFSDSIVYKKNPRYVTNTLDSSVTFKLENLKAGKYLLVALKDANSNYKFDPKEDKIGFQKALITIPTDTVYELELFKEVLSMKFNKPVQASGNKLFLGFEGDARDVAVKLRYQGNEIPSVVTRIPKKDSLQIWYKPIKLAESVKTDSIEVTASKLDLKKTFSVKIKNMKVDTLSLAPSHTGVFPLAERFRIKASIPLEKWDEGKMQLLDKDSTAVPFKLDYIAAEQELAVDFEKQPLQRYKLKLMPGALTDFMQHSNDTLVYKLETKNVSEYGNLRLGLDNVKRFPLIVELTNDKGDVQYEQYSDGPTSLEFNLIKPALYVLRVIYDDNKNKSWDPGNYLEKRQSEEVIYFPTPIDVRANWDVEQRFNLSP